MQHCYNAIGQIAGVTNVRGKNIQFIWRQITGTFLSKEITRGIYARKLFTIDSYQKDNCQNNQWQQDGDPHLYAYEHI